MIYCYTNGEYIKVGCSKDPKARLKSLMNDYPFSIGGVHEVRQVFCVDGSYGLEAAVHKFLRGVLKHQKREWYHHDYLVYEVDWDNMLHDIPMTMFGCDYRSVKYKNVPTKVGIDAVKEFVPMRNFSLNSIASKSKMGADDFVNYVMENQDDFKNILKSPYYVDTTENGDNDAKKRFLLDTIMKNKRGLYQTNFSYLKYVTGLSEEWIAEVLSNDPILRIFSRQVTTINQ